MTDSDLEILKKKLLYRSIHRGCKETDFLIGEFAKFAINSMNNEEIYLYRDFMEEDDLAIYDWILGKINHPKKYSILITEIRKFHKITNN